MLELAYFLNGFLMAAMPLALGAWVARRWKVDWGVFGLGALAFAASQVLHLPFNRFVLLPILGADGDPGVVLRVGGALAVGLSAGIFEEPVRYLVMRLGVRRRGFGRALMFGAGHGGLEAIILGGAALYALIQALSLRDADLSQLVAPGRLDLTRAQLEAFWSAAPFAVLMGAVERVSALMLHLLNSLLVMLSVARREVRWLLLAVLAHTLFNAAALIAIGRLGVYATEGLLFSLGLAAIYALHRLRGRLPAIPETPAGKEQALVARPAAPRPHSEPADPHTLDETRYT